MKLTKDKSFELCVICSKPVSDNHIHEGEEMTKQEEPTVTSDCHNAEAMFNDEGGYWWCRECKKDCKPVFRKDTPASPERMDGLYEYLSRLLADAKTGQLAQDTFNSRIIRLIDKRSNEAVVKELATTCLAGMPELTSRQQDYITKRLAVLTAEEGKG